MSEDAVSPSDLCDVCGKSWAGHWGFNCDEPYADRKWKPLRPGRYPQNRACLRCGDAACRAEHLSIVAAGLNYPEDMRIRVTTAQDECDWRARRSE